jgi:tetratricopeptide (TPR) repeat protein/transglutaminase-like putative cysteine protease
MIVMIIASFLPTLAPAKDWPVARGPARDPNLYRYDPADWKAVPRDFLDDAPACYLRAETSYILEEDGTIETITHEVIRLNSRKAVETLGEHRNMVFNPEYEKLTLHDARIRKPDGKEIPVEAKNVQLRDTQTDFMVYDFSKQLIISFPTLEVGDVLDILWSVRGKNPEYAGQYFSRYQFGDEKYPVYQDQLRILTPEKKTLSYALFNSHLLPSGKLDPAIKKEDGKVLHTWTAKIRRCLPKEEHMPSKEELRPGVAFSTFANWEEVAGWCRKIHAHCWECTADVKKIVADETKNCTTAEEKARALTYWFKRNIRYVSTGEKHDYTPHSPAVILANRYGDCKDGSQFLAVLFKEAGIPAAVASLSVRGDGQILEDLPSPGASHSILLATIDGKEHWIDTTSSFTAWDFLPYADRDRVSYVIDDKSIKLMRTPKMTADENRTDVTTSISFTPDGASNVVRLATYTGSAAITRRDEWIEEPSGERRRVITSDLQEFNSRARLRKVEIDETKLKQLDGPVTARISFVIPNHLRGTPDLEGLVGDNYVWANFLSTSLDWDRTLPMELDRPFESVHRYYLEAPLGYRLTDPPSDEKHTSKWGVFERKVKAEDHGQRWTVEFSTRINKTRIETSELETFRVFQESVQRDYRIGITMRLLQNPEDIDDDIGFLEVIRRVIPSDKVSLTTLAKLYQSTGKNAEANKVLVQALHYYPNERSFVVFAAQTAEGDAIEPAYDKLMKQYPAEKSFVFELVRKLVETQQYDKALARLKPLTETGSNERRGEGHLLLAGVYMAQNKPKEALDHFTQGEKLNAPATETFPKRMLQGQIYQALDKKEDAINAFRAAHGIDDKAPAPIYQLVMLLTDKDETKPEALKLLQELVNIAGDDAEWVINAANAYIDLDRPQQAFDLASKIAGEKNSSALDKTLGVSLTRLGDWEKALPHLDKVAKEDQDLPYLQSLVDVYLHRGDLSKALETAERFKAHDESPPFEIAAVRERLKTLSEREAGKKNPKAAGILVCAHLLHQQNRPMEEVLALLNQIPADAGFAEAHALRAIFAVEEGKLRKALPEAERAIQLNPKDSVGYYARGRIRYEAAHKDATADLQKAVELSERKDAMMLHWLATSLAADGKREEAKKVEKEAAQLLPDNAEIAELLKELEKEKEKAIP